MTNEQRESIIASAIDRHGFVNADVVLDAALAWAAEQVEALPFAETQGPIIVRREDVLRVLRGNVEPSLRGEEMLPLRPPPSKGGDYVKGWNDANQAMLRVLKGEA